MPPREKLYAFSPAARAMYCPQEYSKRSWYPLPPSALVDSNSPEDRLSPTKAMVRKIPMKPPSGLMTSSGLSSGLA